ncbi:MAG: hypothetical protein PVF34_02570 [Gammaproteobacteria bacterium]|jgi:hypothetical protein
MHPVIRIVSFFILAGFVAFGGRYELALGFLIVAVLIAFKRLQSIELSIRIIKRMRWLFLSILIVYLWFTPGQPLIPYMQDAMPTVEGLQTGVLRIFTLVLIILAVNYFVSAIARNQLVEAITWLSYPLRWLGIDNKLLALRIALTLELIPKVQHIVLDMKQHYFDEMLRLRPEKKVFLSGITTRLAAISRIVEILFERIVDNAVNMPAEPLSIHTLKPPPIIQWLVPVGFTGLFLWLQQLGS